MREYKFRCWHDGHGDPQMLYDAQPGDCLRWLYQEGQPVIDIMQFTGLLDYKGREVYESDIVNIRNWGRTDEVLAVAEIVWGEAGWDFEPFFDVDSYDKFRCIEVIGNKWENPGLLE